MLFRSTVSGIPLGGTTGQVLKKASGASYDTAWASDDNTGLLNVVEDTTPQLGGTLNVNGNAINFAGTASNITSAYSSTTLAENSTTGIATQRAIKTYVDNEVSAATGTVVQVVNTQTGAVATGTTILPFDDSDFSIEQL